MKNVLITGGAKGIGRAIAEKLSGDCNLIINYNKSREAAEFLKKNLKGNVEIFKADISNKDEIDKMISFIEKNYKKIDVLINNAAIPSYKMVQDLTYEEYRKVFDTNVFGTIYLTKRIVPMMLHEGGGNILNISSVWGIVGASCESLYSASKGAINAFTKSLAWELAYSNIKVNALAPGPVKTEMVNLLSQKDLEEVKNEIPFGRFADPSEIANLAAFLISDENSFMTGQIISPNGGMTIY